MRLTKRAVLLIVIQVLLVSTIAGKFLYERKVCPRVWTRAAQVDPDSPLRGRYLILPLRVDACGLPKVDQGKVGPMWGVAGGVQEYRRSDVAARGGKLVAVENKSPAGGDRLMIWIPKNTSCDRAILSPGTELYIPESAKMPALKAGEEMWVEVTVPPKGPPRAIQIAVSGNGRFEPIRFE
jgi:hypothetical protein